MTRPSKILTAVFSAGVASLLLELSLLREFAYVAGSTAFSNSLVISIFLAGLALGAYLQTLRPFQPRDEAAASSAFARIQAALIVFIAAFCVTKDYFIYLCPHRGQILAYFAGSALVPSFLAGAAYSAALKILFHCGPKHASYIYACSTVGSVAGGLAHGFVFMNFFGAQSAYACAIACSAWALFLVRPFIGGGAARTALLAVIGLCTAVQTEAASKALYPFYDQLMFRRSSPAGVVEVWRLADGKAFEMTVNNAHQYFSHDWDKLVHVEWARTLLDITDRPSDVLLLGYGSGVTSAAFLRSQRAARVDTVENSRPVLESGARFYPEEYRLATTDPRSHVLVDDFRGHVRFSGRQYDIIALDHRMRDPYAAGFYTKEFFEQLSKILKPGGVVASLSIGLSWDTTTSVFPYVYRNIDSSVSGPFRESVLFFSREPFDGRLKRSYARVGAVVPSRVVYTDHRIEGRTLEDALTQVSDYAKQLGKR